MTSEQSAGECPEEPTPPPATPARPSRLHGPSFWAGFRAASPLIPGMTPFALITGTVTVGIGIEPIKALLMGVILTAGASQLAAVDLLGKAAPILVVVMTGLIVNLRFLMYSASISPYLRGIPPPRKAFYSFLLMDQVYALCILEFSKKEERYDRSSYYAGTAALLWACWIGGNALGAFLGARVPREWGLEFTVPLTFAAILVPLLKSRPAFGAALVGGLTAVAASPLPYNLGLISGAVCGVLAGYHLEMRRRERCGHQ